MNMNIFGITELIKTKMSRNDLICSKSIGFVIGAFSSKYL